IEMCADDQARRKSSSRELAMALLRFGAAGPAPVPAGAMAAVRAAEPAVMRRVNRLLRPDDELPYHAGAVIMGASAFLLATVTCRWRVPIRAGARRARLPPGTVCDLALHRARSSCAVRLPWRVGGTPFGHVWRLE